MTSILEELLDICYYFVIVCAIFSATTIVFTLVAVAFGTAWAPPTKKKTTFTGNAQSLGRGVSSSSSSSSLSSMKAARLARLDKVTAKTVTKTKKSVSTKTSLRDHNKPRPTSDASLKASKAHRRLPEELKPGSLKHFFVDGATKVCAIPNLRHAEKAMARLERIVKEFMPIIQKRNFNIRSISEMCCCGNGLEYELGGGRRCVGAGQSIAGNDPDTVAGYNGKLTDSFGKTEHVIHLRLRSPQDHDKFMSYDEVVDTMAHELAHCVHEDHGPEFWDLMDAILQDRAKIMEELEKGNEARIRRLDPISASKQQFDGFNIYGSFSGRLRNVAAGSHNRPLHN